MGRPLEETRHHVAARTFWSLLDRHAEAGVANDPYPLYRRLRETKPAARIAARGAWVLSRYRDVSMVFHHPQVSSDIRNGSMYRRFLGRFGESHHLDLVSSLLLFQDPPTHTRLRGLVKGPFRPSSVELLRPRIEAIVDSLLDHIERKGEGDIVADLGVPLASTVLFDMLGIPFDQHVGVRRWIGDLAPLTDPVLQSAARERALASLVALRDALGPLLADRESADGGDSDRPLVQSLGAPPGDAQDEASMLALVLLFAGLETTASQVANSVLALLRHPDQWARLRDDPGSATSAALELLRYDGAAQMVRRIALADLAVGGATIRAGEAIWLLIGSANRDPERFPDADRLDIMRPDAEANLSFAAGVHYCLGAQLATVEIALALAALARRFPDLQLASEEVRYRDTVSVRGPATLPVRVR